MGGPILLSKSRAAYFIGSDINLGMDSSGAFRWITDNGRFGLIHESDYLTDEEKSILLGDTNFTFPYQ